MVLRRQGCGHMDSASDWEMQADLRGKLVVPQEENDSDEEE